MPAICRRHLRINLLVWKLFCFDFKKNVTEICSQSQIYKMPSLVRKMDLRRAGDKPLSKSAMAYFTGGVYIVLPDLSIAKIKVVYIQIN